MQTVTELKLPHLAMQSPEFAADPMRYVTEARRQHPWLATTDTGFYFVHEYEAIKDLSYMDDKFRPAMDGITDFMNAKGGPWAHFFDNTMLCFQPPEHTRLRGGVAASFTPRAINRHRELVQKIVAALLDDWAPKGKFDFAEFAANFPIRVMFGLMGASTDRLPGILKALETQGMGANLVREMLPDLNQSIVVMEKFVNEVLAERRAKGGGDEDDMLNTLLATQAAGQINEDELINTLVFLFGAGYDTSKNMLTFIMYEMLKNPDMWARCAEDRPYCDLIVEETLRIHSVSSIYRIAMEDVVYRDIRFPKNTTLFLTLQLAARDPAAFEDAERFWPERPNVGRHFAFGRGIHMCLGQHLARAQLQEGIHVIAQRLRNPRLVGDITWRPFPGVWGIRTLPIEFQPGARK